MASHSAWAGWAQHRFGPHHFKAGTLPPEFLLEQRALENRDRLAGDADPVLLVTNAQQSAAAGELPGDETVATEAFRPVRPETALGRTGHRVLIHTHLGREKPRDKIILPRRPTTGHHHTSRRYLRHAQFGPRQRCP